MKKSSADKIVNRRLNQNKKNAFKLYRLILWLKKPSNTLWVTPTLGGVFAVIFALIAKFGSFLLPSAILPDISIDIVESLLDVISNTMLAVSTFSLSIMVSAFAAASNGATPRATSLVMADDNTRIAIASFISAFIYAVIGKIALGLDYYTQNGRFILFISTILVLIYVIITLIRWVHTLSTLGRLDNTISKIYDATKQALAKWLADPQFGISGDAPDREHDAQYHSASTGYIAHIYFSGLNKIAKENNLHIRLNVRPGHFTYLHDPIANIWGETNEYILEEIGNCFVIEPNRSYMQDPRFGLLVMSEVAQRALSPAVNDPGTALTIINNLSTILTDTQPEEQKEDYPHLSLGQANYTDLIRQPFDPIARDGAGNYEVQIRLMKALASIAHIRSELALACEKQAYRALEYASALPIDSDKETLARLTQHLFPKEEEKQDFEPY
ncbi:DUF2254 domain-containing protein [Suttonella ornithocola]|uniref:Predicted membrane protein (DUF2254) n=1 Tax=Suttonella ornithocola TaxID=279832 RepID=A0A380MSS2_9GAMM|nr:DUF2254 domain-containing protein [Suttonella ornithocola]SUO95595.1 Predicted membrane protein (DUF2254) [Suttonella ornithocola]